MPVIIVQNSNSGNMQGTSGPFSLALPSPSAAGNRLIALVAFANTGESVGVGAVTDSLTNTPWLLLTDSALSGHQLSAGLWLSPVLPPSATAPTVSVSPTSNASSYTYGVSLIEVSGLAATPLDVASTIIGTGDPASTFGITPPVGPIASGELVLAIATARPPIVPSAVNIGWQTPQGFVNAYNNPDGLNGLPWSFAWRLTEGIEIEAPTWGINVDTTLYAAALVALQPAVSPSVNTTDPSTPPFPVLSVDQWATRLAGLTPTQWSSNAAKTPGGVLYALLRTFGGLFNAVEQAIPYAWLNRSLLTAFGPTLDTAVTDFFGTALPRLPAESDTAYRTRALARLFLPGATRAALVSALTRLTGQVPVVVEPWNPSDVYAMDVGFRDVSGPYGLRYASMGLPYQCFVTTVLPPLGSGENGPLYGYNDGMFFDTYTASMLDLTPGIGGLQAVYEAINSVKPEGVVVWTAIGARTPPVTATPPSVPTGLTATAVSTSQVNLVWTASTAGSLPVAGYRIYRNGVLVGTSTIPSFDSTGLISDTAYTFGVSAYDTSGLASALSSPVNVTTLTAPSVPTHLVATMESSYAIGLTWTASTAGSLPIAGYDIYQGGVKVGTSTTTSFTCTGLAPGTSYLFTVVAYDTAGNLSGPSGAVSQTTATLPAAPTGLTATSASSSQINLSWTAAVAGTLPIAGYDIYRNGMLVGTSTTTSYSDTGLTASTTYTYTAAAYDTANDLSAQSTPASATTGAPVSGFLPAGHWIAAKQPMILVYPRPDSETQSFARHHWAYYDGVNAVEYHIPIGVEFGAYPYVFSLVSGPAGMAIGQAWSDPDYGVLTWTPTAAVSSANVQVSVTDQQNNVLTVTFTVSTSSNTAHFVFVDAVNGLDTNSGTITAPLKTLTAAYGSTFAQVINPGAICYLRGTGGTYTPPIYADQDINTGWPMMEFSTTAKPAAMIGFPGDPTLPLIDMTSCGWGANVNVNDLFFQDLNPNGYLTTQANYRLMWAVGAGMARLTADNVGWTNSGYGSSATNNATGWFIDINNTTQAANIFLNNCYETNRQSGQLGNNYAGCSGYNVLNWLVNKCYIEQNGLLLDGAWYMKSDVTNGCVRGCTVNVGATGGYTHAFDFGQAPDSQMTDCESCYNIAVGGGGIFLPFNGGYTFGPLWGYRNSVNSSNGMGSNDPNSGGPYVFDSNAIQSATALPTGTSIQTDGLNLVEATGLLDSNGLLTSAYSSYLGTVGAQIG